MSHRVEPQPRLQSFQPVANNGLVSPSTPTAGSPTSASNATKISPSPLDPKFEGPAFQLPKVFSPPVTHATPSVDTSWMDFYEKNAEPTASVPFIVGDSFPESLTAGQEIVVMRYYSPDSLNKSSREEIRENFPETTKWLDAFAEAMIDDRLDESEKQKLRVLGLTDVFFDQFPDYEWLKLASAWIPTEWLRVDYSISERIQMAKRSGKILEAVGRRNPSPTPTAVSTAVSNLVRAAAAISAEMGLREGIVIGLTWESNVVHDLWYSGWEKASSTVQKVATDLPREARGAILDFSQSPLGRGVLRTLLKRHHTETNKEEVALILGILQQCSVSDPTEIASFKSTLDAAAIEYNENGGFGLEEEFAETRRFLFPKNPVPSWEDPPPAKAAPVVAAKTPAAPPAVMPPPPPKIETPTPAPVATSTRSPTKISTPVTSAPQEKDPITRADLGKLQTAWLSIQAFMNLKPRLYDTSTLNYLDSLDFRRTTAENVSNIVFQFFMFFEYKFKSSKVGVQNPSLPVSPSNFHYGVGNYKLAMDALDQIWKTLKSLESSLSSDRYLSQALAACRQDQSNLWNYSKGNAASNVDA